MSEGQDNATVTFKLGSAQIEIPERKAKREIDRLRGQIQRELVRAQEFLDRVGLTRIIDNNADLLARPSSSNSSPTIPGATSPSAAEAEFLPAYTAQDNARNAPPSPSPFQLTNILDRNVDMSTVSAATRRTIGSAPLSMIQSASQSDPAPQRSPVAPQPPPYSPHSPRSSPEIALNTNNVRSHESPAVADAGVVTLPSSPQHMEGGRSSGAYGSRSPTSHVDPSRDGSQALHISRRSISAVMEPDETDAELNSAERQQVMEPVPSHPFFRRRGARRMPTWTSAAEALQSDTIPISPQIALPPSPYPFFTTVPEPLLAYSPQPPSTVEERACLESIPGPSHTPFTSTVQGPSNTSINVRRMMAGAESLGRVATTSSARNALMTLVVNEAVAAMGSLPNHEDVIRACLQSESAFNTWVQYCQTVENGRQFADALLCTMQRMLDQPRPRLADSALQLLRRTMMKLSVKCQVIPSILFQHGAECYEPLPRSGGSFGDVFHGTLAGKEVALKRLRLFQVVDKDEYYRDLCREALLWRQLHHPFVLPFLGLDGDPASGAVYMISPWMANGSIPKYMQEHPEDVTARLKRIWISQAASGLSYLHDNGIVHGDLRGANILLDEHNYVHLADFGLAKIADAGKSTLGVSTWHSGAARWMPPEVLKGGRCTFSGDVYSFASVCLEIASQQYPFPQLAKDAQVIAWVCVGNIPEWPDTSDPDLNEVGYFVTSAWDGNPERRPNMKALRDSLAL